MAQRRDDGEVEQQSYDRKGRPVGLPPGLTRGTSPTPGHRKVPDARGDIWPILGHLLRRRILLAFLDLADGEVLSASTFGKRYGGASKGDIVYAFKYLAKNSALDHVASVQRRGAIRNDYVLSDFGRKMARFVVLAGEVFLAVGGLDAEEVV